ncbi:hypothetical protein IE077_003957 [Cardiosporidium cionae]|uniref:Uncharacterized protein n=1 Tax=Cardiosporidium cionae TaxID=476202 RepID=A0ABQ7J752_9APIC|nr:hypothetical protein IE077_003957 [Cardiosporidium cionae]|eukprot:KAF8819817.1 hypothetical protein IE077_003957 [Cardiosporidium cionae]
MQQDDASDANISMKIPFEKSVLQSASQEASVSPTVTVSNTMEFPMKRTILPIFQTLSDTGHYLFGSPASTMDHGDSSASPFEASLAAMSRPEGELPSHERNLSPMASLSPFPTATQASPLTALDSLSPKEEIPWQAKQETHIHTLKEETIHSRRISTKEGHPTKRRSYQPSKRIASLSLYDSYFRIKRVEPEYLSLSSPPNRRSMPSRTKTMSHVDTPFASPVSFSFTQNPDVFSILSQPPSGSPYKNFSMASGVRTLDTFTASGLERNSGREKEPQCDKKAPEVLQAEGDEEGGHGSDALSLPLDQEEMEEGPLVLQDRAIDTHIETIRFNAYRDAMLLHKWIQPFIEIAIASTSSLTALTALLPSETWLPSEILAVVCNVILSLQTISGFRLPFLFLNRLGFELLRNTLELGCQMILFKHLVRFESSWNLSILDREQLCWEGFTPWFFLTSLMLGNQLKTFLSLAASVLDLETACPDIQVPVSVIKGTCHSLFCNFFPLLLLVGFAF